MRIFIVTLKWTKFPLEVESFDTIDYVKGLIREKEGDPQCQQGLIFEGLYLDDSKTLAECNIQNGSSIQVVVGRLPKGWHVFIKTFTEKPLGLLAQPSDTINKVKARIEEWKGIPINGQRLLFSGKELDNGNRTLEEYGIQIGSTLRLVRLRGDGDDTVDIAAVQARRKAAFSKAKGAEVGSKRAREESSSVAYDCVRNIAAAQERRKEALSKAEEIGNPAEMQNVTTFLQSELQEYMDRWSQEEEVKRLTDEKYRMMDEMQKLKQQLFMESLTGASFLQSEAGRRYIVTLEREAAKSAVDDFKESAIFKEIVMNRSMNIYDDVVKECQSLLRKSGRVSEDIIQLLDPHGYDQGDGEGEIGNNMKFMMEFDMERSTVASISQYEVWRRHIVSLQRQTAKSAIEEFKEGALFREIVMNRAMSVYDDVVKECQRLLRESGRVSEDIIQLLDHPRGDE